MEKLFNTVNYGVGDEDIFFNPVITKPIFTVKKPKVEDFLKRFESALSFDISMAGTGITEWHREGSKIEHYSIHVDGEVDLDKDSLAEEKMRLAYEKDVLDLFEGKHYEVIVVENVFGGSNFDTVRKLLALNSVIGTLVLRGSILTDNFYKRSNKVWKKYLSKVYRVKGLKDKLNIEQALLYMEYPLAVNYTNASSKVKDDLCYQDLLDSMGMLVGLSIELSELDNKKASKRNLQMRDITLSYVVDLVDLDFLDDDILKEASFEQVDLDMDLEKKILLQSQEGYDKEEETAYVMRVENEKLGAFGTRHDLPFLEQGFLYLVFYDKWLTKRIKERLSKRE